MCFVVWVLSWRRRGLKTSEGKVVVLFVVVVVVVVVLLVFCCVVVVVLCCVCLFVAFLFLFCSLMGFFVCWLFVIVVGFVFVVLI